MYKGLLVWAALFWGGYRNKVSRDVHYPMCRGAMHLGTLIEQGIVIREIST